jgi:hypothetical protein
VIFCCRGIAALGVSLACLTNSCMAGAESGFGGGHLKLQGLLSSYADDSIFRDIQGANSHDENGELRLKFNADDQRWAIRADYQLIARHGDTLTVSEQLGATFLGPGVVPSDDRRWWDLTDEIQHTDDYLLVQRLDRLHLGYTGDALVVRFGRQAVSWGNGLIYNPMDVFNPFDPAAIDTEYKVGDDMLYSQYLTDSGDDWQFVQAWRRNDNGAVSSRVNSTAIKYHGFLEDGEQEYDLLLAQHYDQWMLGLGGAASVGGAVVRGDLTLTETDHDWVASLVANWSYSWTWGGYNVSAVAEYFYSGFGLHKDDYSLQALLSNPQLAQRISRGELYTLGRHYVASSLLLEVTPLLSLIPNVFVNVSDGSALGQLNAQWDIAQNWQILASVSIPMGPKGTEYGGLETGLDELTTQSGRSFFTQLAWYF